MNYIFFILFIRKHQGTRSDIMSLFRLSCLHFRWGLQVCKGTHVQASHSFGVDQNSRMLSYICYIVLWPVWDISHISFVSLMTLLICILVIWPNFGYTIYTLCFVVNCPLYNFLCHLKCS